MKEKIKFTPEQLNELQSFFRQNDFTENMTLSRECTFKGEQAEIFIRTKKIFGECQCCQFFRTDFGNLHRPGQAERIYLSVFEMYGEPVMLGLACYAKSVSKEVDDLTDDEIHTVVEKVAIVIDKTLIETVMQGQQVPQIFGISR